MQRWYRSALISTAFFTFASVFTLIAEPARADGSVSFAADVLPLIKARPVFEKFIRDTFQIADTGWGVRIGNEAMPHLGGARMGPYEFQAVWHSPNGDVSVTLIVDTDIKFFDRKGREIRNGQLKNATNLKETFSAIEIEPSKN